MPYKKRYTNRNIYAGKRAYNRRKKKFAMMKRRAAQRLSSNVQGVLIPDKTLVTLKYNEDIVMNVTAGGAPANYTFRCNSIYDPNTVIISPTQHQPLGHDEYSRFYKKYVVVAAKATFTFTVASNSTQTNDSGGFMDVGVCTIADQNGITDAREFKENNRTTYKKIMPNMPLARITKHFNAKKFFGLSRILDNERYGADFGTDPAQLAYWQLQAVNPILTTTTSYNVYCNVAIKYTCVLRERINLGLS